MLLNTAEGNDRPLYIFDIHTINYWITFYYNNNGRRYWRLIIKRGLNKETFSGQIYGAAQLHAELEKQKE